MAIIDNSDRSRLLAFICFWGQTFLSTWTLFASCFKTFSHGCHFRQLSMYIIVFQCKTIDYNFSCLYITIECVLATSTRCLSNIVAHILDACRLRGQCLNLSYAAVRTTDNSVRSCIDPHVDPLEFTGNSSAAYYSWYTLAGDRCAVIQRGGN